MIRDGDRGKSCVASVLLFVEKGGAYFLLPNTFNGTGLYFVFLNKEAIFVFRYNSI